MRTCTDCGESLPLTKFLKRKTPAGTTYYRGRCNKCRSAKERSKPSYNSPENVAKRNQRAKKYRDQADRASNMRKWRMQLKISVVEAYGGKCACCDEDELLFLTVDHINNDGAEHRKALPGGSSFYVWLKNNDWPEGFQILCFNCNTGKHLNGGVCPHQDGE